MHKFVNIVLNFRWICCKLFTFALYFLMMKNDFFPLENVVVHHSPDKSRSFLIRVTSISKITNFNRNKFVDFSIHSNVLLLISTGNMLNSCENQMGKNDFHWRRKEKMVLFFLPTVQLMMNEPYRPRYLQDTLLIRLNVIPFVRMLRWRWTEIAFDSRTLSHTHTHRLEATTKTKKSTWSDSDFPWPYAKMIAM